MAQTTSKTFKAIKELSYSKWLESHAQKHAAIIQKLLQKNFTKKQIISYFKYENLKEMEPHFCPLFINDQKCHDMKDLNCFFCGCPHFRFYENPIERVHSYCAINSLKGVQNCYKNQYHQDCSDCTIPHETRYILQNYTLNWYKIMKMCKKETHNK